MLALVETVGKEANVRLFESAEELENTMKARYAEEVKKAFHINWKITSIDISKGYGIIDNWNSIREFRIGKVIDGC